MRNNDRPNIININSDIGTSLFLWYDKDTFSLIGRHNKVPVLQSPTIARSG